MRYLSRMLVEASHNATDRLLINIGGHATVDAQFMVFTILGDAKPARDWPAGAIMPTESGYYTQNLVSMNGQWLIESLQTRQYDWFALSNLGVFPKGPTDKAWACLSRPEDRRSIHPTALSALNL
jgi:hypothetical protein